MLSPSDVISVNEQQVAAKIMDGEAILINLGTGAYYSLGSTGGFIWSLIELRLSVSDIVRSVTEHYDVAADRVQADVTHLAEQLSAEGLIDVAAGAVSAATAPPPAGTRLPYAVPTLDKFTDMAEMFALDPPLPGLSQAPAKRGTE
ncbi:MAG: PqqD family peptide modification chaperone [Pseudomonadota bacterium]